MDKLLYIAMTGARENMLAQQIHSNNLANVSTTAFKSDFEQARAMRVMGDGYESRVYAQTERPGTDFESGTLMETGNKLDVAIDGQGWIAVQTPEGGEAYTRAGNLQFNALGQLVNGSGLPVLGNGDVPIQIPSSSQVQISDDGTINILPDGDNATDLVQVDRIKLVNPDPSTVYKGVDGLMRVDGGLPQLPDLTVRVRSGYLETSNVNAVAELTDIISLSKQFEIQISMMNKAEENSSAAASILELS